jgi:hypothetical protein
LRMTTAMPSRVRQSVVSEEGAELPRVGLGDRGRVPGEL